MPFYQFNENPNFKNNNLIKTYPHDAGWDIRINQDLCLWPGESSQIKTGLHIVMPKGFKGIVKSRSGLAVNKLIECSNAGVIDYGYTGEIILRIYNNSKQEKFMAHTGNCIAQIIFDYSHTVPSDELRHIAIPQQIPELKPAEFFSLEFDRANNGRGSTGR